MFKPFSGQQLKLLTWWILPQIARQYDAVIADGAIRSGKTMSMSLGYVLWSMHNFTDQNFAICGKTVGSCYRNVIKPLLSMLAARYTAVYKRSDNLLIITDGRKSNYYYVFGGKDESSQDLIQGITLAGVMLDEVALMPRSFVDQALARCSVEGSKYWFNCNPDTPYHWFYREWIRPAAQKRALYLHFCMDDNLTLSESTKARYKSLYSGTFYERYILGRWVAADGLVYPMFDHAKHVVEPIPRNYSQYYVSVDYGTLNPFSAGLWGCCSGVWYRIAEYYYDGRARGKQLTDEEYYTAMVQLIGGLPITAVIVDPSAASYIACIRRHGRYNVIPANNAVLDGIRLTATCLQQGKIAINSCCTNTLQEITAYVWDTQRSQKTGEDRPVKEHDHAMDDIRYFCQTILRSTPGLVDIRR